MGKRPYSHNTPDDSQKSLHGPLSVESFKVLPAVLNEHMDCPLYLDHSQLTFTHLSLDSENPFNVGETDSCLLFFMIAGSCRVESSECDNPIEIRAGQMLFIAVGSSFKASGSPLGECMLLHFSEFTFCEMLTLQNLARQTDRIIPRFEPHPIAPPLEAFVRNMLFYTDNRINCSHLQRIKQEECFILIRICYTREALARIFAPLLCDKSIALRMKIQRFAARTHTIADLAARCEMTQITMKRKIQALFGVPAHRWMLRQRNRQILFDLRSGRTLKEICYSYGYSSLSNFTAYCKRQFGLPPSQIMKLSQEEYTKLQHKIQK